MYSRFYRNRKQELSPVHIQQIQCMPLYILRQPHGHNVTTQSEYSGAVEAKTIVSKRIDVRTYLAIQETISIK